MPHTHPLHHPNETEWPTIVPAVCAGAVALIAGIAMIQPRSSGYTPIGGALATLVILAPFIVDLVGALRGRPTPRLWLLFVPVPVAAGVAYFMFHPADVDAAPFILVFLTGEIVSRSRGNGAAAIFPGALGIATVVLAEAVGPWSDGAFIWVAGIGFGWLGGYLIRELDARTHELQAAQAGLAEKAASEERSRIAREVHDVIAHTLSVTMLHISAARMALAKGDDRDGAIDSLWEAERHGRRSLAEIRRTVGLLGPDDAVAPPLPTTADLPKLVQDFRDAGLDVVLQMDGAVDAIPAPSGLNLYRIVQESLTNVAKHAPHATATVVLDVTEEEIRLRVHNGTTNGSPFHGADGGRADGGHGLKGMAERAAMLGGSLETDATDGWAVTVVAPRQHA